MSHAAQSRPVHAALTRGTCDPGSLIAAIRRVVHAAGDVTLLAEITGLSRRDLYRWATDPTNESGEHRTMPAHAIETLTKATGRDDLVEYFARAAGGVFVRIPRALDGAGDLLATAAGITAAIGRFQQEAARALTDGAVSDAEKRALDVAMEQIAQLATGGRLALKAPPERKPNARAGR